MANEPIVNDPCPHCQRHREETKRHIQALAMWAETVILDDEENARLQARIDELEDERTSYERLTRDLVAVGAQLQMRLSKARRRIKHLETVAGVRKRSTHDRESSGDE
jgi:uncharacterized coiled-coil protein SlyX